MTTLTSLVGRCLVLFALCLSAACVTPEVAPEVTSEVGPDATPEGGEAVEPIEGYLLGQGDRISIQVFDEPDLTMESRIGGSGVINYSYLGDLRVAGKSAQRLEREIADLLRDGYLVNPAVNVTVIEYRPFFINGEVRAPGSYPYQPGLTLDKAIALAGGLTDRASTRKMSIIKARAGDNRAMDARMNTRVEPGDIVSIDEGFF